jgi:hypothetical protein
MPTIGTATIAIRVEAEGARPDRRAVSAAAPARPIVPRPLWERHQLFQEPSYPAGFDLLEDDEDDDTPAA